MIHIIREHVTAEQIQDMLQQLEGYIKLAVDIERRVLAGGGGMHADCEAVLLADGSTQANVWGADWLPDTCEVTFESLINVRPKHGNRKMVIEDTDLQAIVESIVRERLDIS